MDSRERYVRALTFEGPDRAPIMHRTVPGALRKYGVALDALYEKYPSDALLSPATRGLFDFHDKGRGDPFAKGITYDDWGTGWRYTTSDYSGLACKFPLSDWRAFDSYRPPDPMTGEEGVLYMEEVVRQDGHWHFVCAFGGHLFQRMWFLRGYMESLVDLQEDRPELYALRDMLVGWIIRRTERWLETRVVDCVMLGDDFGSQTALMVRPSVWRKFFKPAYKRIVDAIHAGGAYASFHTDGYTLEIIQDLIDVGFDELNPQVTLMDVEELGRRFGGKVCFRADLDRQSILPWGTPDQVRTHVQRMFRAFGGFNGGYVGYGSVGTDVPLENIQAMLGAFAACRYDQDRAA
ncbi:MAG: uroporphyrinogen decarboxylase family protein [Chloroflexota bacterium]|nr:uroporphyrinogen decarboxylase family protein [Chloroflexota bacterium]